MGPPEQQIEALIQEYARIDMAVLSQKIEDYHEMAKIMLRKARHVQNLHGPPDESTIIKLRNELLWLNRYPILEQLTRNGQQNELRDNRHPILEQLRRYWHKNELWHNRYHILEHLE